MSTPTPEVKITDTAPWFVAQAGMLRWAMEEVRSQSVELISNRQPVNVTQIMTRLTTQLQDQFAPSAAALSDWAFLALVNQVSNCAGMLLSSTLRLLEASGKYRFNQSREAIQNAAHMAIAGQSIQMELIAEPV